MYLPMDKHIAWIDLTRAPNNIDLKILNHYQLDYLDGRYQNRLEQLLLNNDYEPEAIVIRYDTPDSSGLRLLEKIKTIHRSVPLLMITKSHSEALAVWALRNRVWDYLVEPLSSKEINATLDKILGDESLNESEEKWHSVTKISAAPNNAGNNLNSYEEKHVKHAIQYIEAHYADQITQLEVAKQVGVSSSHLSRIFKKHNQCGFNALLWKIRIREAKTLLLASDCSVSEISYDIGCSDPSYFTTKFRQETGSSPSEFRSQSLSAEKNNYSVQLRSI